jgi:hypothetical protein
LIGCPAGFYASQFSVTGALYTCQPDLVGFVKCLLLGVIELKKPNASPLQPARPPHLDRPDSTYGTTD